MEPKTSPTHKFDETTDEIMDVTTMVNQIDSLELTMQLMFDQIKYMADMQTHVLRKTTTTDLDIELTEAGVDAPETSTRAPPVGPMRWQLKDLKPTKFNGNAATHSADAVEKWLSK